MPKQPTQETTAPIVIENPWERLRAFTDARIGLGRAGVSLPTKQLLAFQLAHAQAQDAVHCPLECEVLADELTQALGLSTAPLAVHSRAEDRAMYLQRPDYGRRLNEASREALQQAAESGQRFDLAVVIVDGLSALAVQQNSAPFLTALYDALGRDKNEWRLAPLILVEQGRVAIGDEVGALLNADAVLVMVGASNAVNLTDGLDGLAIVPVMIAAGVFALIAYLVGNSVFSTYLQLHYVPGAGELAVFLGALVGGGLGFLWFNAPPAKVFMGDTGSLSLGGALGTISIITKHELVLAIVGGLFVLETISVIVQVVSFRLTGKRIFAMAPLHHHFEKKGWAESTIVIRFWIIASILALAGLSTLKLR